MENDTLVQLIQNVNNLSANDAEILEEIAISYPYCQNTYFLLAKYAQTSQDDFLVKKIRKAATYAYNRMALKNLIENTTDTPIKTSFFETNAQENNLRQTRVLEDTSDLTKEPSKEQTFEFTEEEINESYAMDLVQNGEDAKAIAIYKKLIAYYPEKDSYYRSQISVLSGEEFTEVIEPIQRSAEADIEETITPTTFEETPITFDEPEETPITEKSEESFFDVIEETEMPVFEVEQEEAKPNNTNNSIEIEEDNSDTASFFENLDVDKEVEIMMPPQENEVLETETPNISVTDEDDIDDEKEAVFLFNQGKTKEAVAIYETLMQKFPNKKDYYRRQIQVLDGYNLENNREEAGNTPVIESPNEVIGTAESTEENLSFFDNLDIDTEESSYAIDDDSLSEGQALDLFNEGRTEEAVKIYKLLMEKNPEKADYYRNQIDILKN